MELKDAVLKDPFVWCEAEPDDGPGAPNWWICRYCNAEGVIGGEHRPHDELKDLSRHEDSCLYKIARGGN